MKFDIYNHVGVAEQSGTAILKFFATWCVPCRALATTLKSNQFEKYDLSIFEIDVDHHIELAEIFGIRSVPTLVFLRNGEEVARLVGNANSDKIIKAIEENLI